MGKKSTILPGLLKKMLDDQKRKKNTKKQTILLRRARGGFVRKKMCLTILVEVLRKMSDGVDSILGTWTFSPCFPSSWGPKSGILLEGTVSRCPPAFLLNPLLHIYKRSSLLIGNNVEF